MKTRADILKQDRRALADIAGIFGLEPDTLSGLFRVDAQAVARWKVQGVPPEHRGKLQDIAQLARSMRRQFIANRIPIIVRAVSDKPEDELAGGTILSVVRDRGTGPVLAYMNRLFAYIGT